jgi:hypothetical protein
VVDAAEAAGDWPCALEHARRGLAIDPLQERLLERAAVRARSLVGDEAAGTFCREGRAMTLEQAIACALGE